jgi:hypothetical protein
MTIDTYSLIEYGLIAAAPILLAWEWRLRLGVKKYPLSLIVVTISSLWILLALAWRGALGPDYSDLHAYITLVNALADLICAILAATIKTQRSYRTVIAGMFLAFVWAFTLSIMYAV